MTGMEPQNPFRSLSVIIVCGFRDGSGTGCGYRLKSENRPQGWVLERSLYGAENEIHGGKNSSREDEQPPVTPQRGFLPNGQTLNMLREGEVEYIDAELYIEHCAYVLDDMEPIREPTTF
jgi:hypothetical protein